MVLSKTMLSTTNDIFTSAYFKTDTDSTHTEDMYEKNFTYIHIDSISTPISHNLFK